MTKKPSPIISYILALVVTILIASYAISFFVQKSAVCDKDHVQLCATENICSTDGLYWWDNACHLIEQPKPAPSEYPDYDALQGMKSLCRFFIFSRSCWWSGTLTCAAAFSFPLLPPSAGF